MIFPDNPILKKRMVKNLIDGWSNIRALEINYPDNKTVIKEIKRKKDIRNISASNGELKKIIFKSDNSDNLENVLFDLNDKNYKTFSVIKNNPYGLLHGFYIDFV
jgi:hypothetical protein